MLNKTILIGRLTREPELQQTSNGIAYTRFTLAVNRKIQSDEADFINVVAWRGLAENCTKYLGKGSQVAIEGRIQTGKYQNQEGQTIYTFDVVADDVRFLDTRKKKELDENPFDGEPVEIDDEDLPWKL